MANEKRLIDANELIDRLNHTTMVAYPNLFPGLLAAVEIVDDSPTVDAVQVVHGRWIKRRFTETLSGYECSNCSTTWDAETNYCPNCGAKMDGERKEK